MPTEDVGAYLKSFNVWYEMGDGKPKISVEQVIAVRGERLVLVRNRVGYMSGEATEFLYVFQFDQQLGQVERQVAFDVDDVGAAIAELNEMHAELEQI